MEKQKDSKSSKKRRRRLWPAVIGAVFLLTAAILTLLIAYNPRSYNPIIPENPQEVSSYLTHKLGPDFYDQVQLDKPFELIVDQEGLNDIFSHTDWPLCLDRFSIYTPMVEFSPEKSVLMAQVDYRGLSTILSVVGKPSLDTEGKLNLHIQSVYLGALPVTPLAQHLARQYTFENLVSPDVDDRTAEVMEAIIDNRPFDPIVYIYDQAARITELRIEAGSARLMLTPIPASAAKGL